MAGIEGSTVGVSAGTSGGGAIGVSVDVGIGVAIAVTEGGGIASAACVPSGVAIGVSVGVGVDSKIRGLVSVRGVLQPPITKTAKPMLKIKSTGRGLRICLLTGSPN